MSIGWKGSEAEQRTSVVAEARAWLGTPYHHAARVRGAGVDCAMLLAAIYEDAGVIPSVAFERYSMDWMLHRDTERLLDVVTRYSRDVSEQTGPGDLIIYRYGRAYAHGAIVVDWPMIIHAVQRSGVILDDADAAQLAGRDRRIFTLWGS